jgi:nicotinamidase-related amidase
VIEGLLDAYRSARRPVIHVIRLYDGTDVDRLRRTAIAGGAQIVRPGSQGSQIVPALRLAGSPDLDPSVLLTGAPQRLGPGEFALFKPRWSAFHRTGLDAHLAGLDLTTLVFAGCNYPNCPRASIYDASERDYRVVLVRDAISGVMNYHLEEATRIGVVPLPASAVVAALARLHRRSTGRASQLTTHHSSARPVARR